MTEWKLEDAQRCLGEVVRRAERCGPQRVEGPDGSAVLLGEADFKLLLADAGLREADLHGGGDAPGGEPMSFLELMQRSPLAEAFRAGDFSPEEWDRACRIGR